MKRSKTLAARLAAGVLFFAAASSGWAQIVLPGDSGKSVSDAFKAQDVPTVSGKAVPGKAAVAEGASREADRVSLLPQFPGASNRSQCDVGSCHAFGSVAVLEAALYRKYKTHYRLSEADIFLRRTVLSKDLYEKFCEDGTCELSEGNDPLGDIRFAIAKGVATSIGYRGFLARYRRYRKAEEATLRGIQETYEDMSWLERLFYDPREHWAELQNRPAAKRRLERLLVGSDDTIDKERADMKKKLKGFTVVQKSFKYYGKKASGISNDDCRKKGVEQAKLLREELKDSRRPPVVSMSLSNLPAWGQTDTSKHANHAFAIVGYRSTTAASGDKSVVFETRNSWGGDNPDVHAHELCRIYRIATVLTPEEVAKESR